MSILLEEDDGSVQTHNFALPQGPANFTLLWYTSAYNIELIFIALYLTRKILWRKPKVTNLLLNCDPQFLQYFLCRRCRVVICIC